MAAAEDWALVALELLGAVAAFFSAARVFAAHRVVPAPSLRRFGAGFALLGLSQVAAALVEVLLLRAGDALDTEHFGALDVAFWAYYGTLFLGLAFVFASFGRRPFQWAPALVPLLLRVGQPLQFLTILLLFFVVLHAGLNHIARKAPGSVQTALGFFVLLLAQILNLVDYSPLAPRNLLGELLQFVGLLVLYLAVARPRTVPNA